MIRSIFRQPHLLIVVLLFAAGCTPFNSPPKAELFGAEEGVLSDPTAPIIVSFHEQYDESTLKLKIITFETDPEGNLADEDDDPETNLDVLFEHDGETDTSIGGTHGIDESGRFFSMTLNTTLPIGPALAIIIEPGLADFRGEAWKVRQRIVFGYNFTCATDAAMPVPTLFPSATHFMLVEVQDPLAVQLQLFAVMVTNPETSNVVGQFSNADRDPETDCGMNCGADDVCRTIPQNECVRPSQSASTADEYPDYVANPTPPMGYSFTVKGCIKDQPDGTFTFANAPVDIEVESPPVSVKGINFNGSFRLDDEDGALRGAGTFTAQELFLGETASGPASGTIITREVPAAEIKPGTPGPDEDQLDDPPAGG